MFLRFLFFICSIIMNIICPFRSSVNCEYGTYDYLVLELGHIFHDMVYDQVTMIPRRRSEKRLRTRRNLFRSGLFRRSRERERENTRPQKIRNKEKRPKTRRTNSAPPRKKKENVQHREKKKNSATPKEKKKRKAWKEKKKKRSNTTQLQEKKKAWRKEKE